MRSETKRFCLTFAAVSGMLSEITQMELTMPRVAIEWMETLKGAEARKARFRACESTWLVFEKNPTAEFLDRHFAFVEGLIDPELTVDRRPSVAAAGKD